MSGKQHRFMALCRHNPQHARGKCPPEKVSGEFLAADRGKKFSKGSKGKMQREALK
jgi:hypothetical protein